MAVMMVEIKFVFVNIILVLIGCCEINVIKNELFFKTLTIVIYLIICDL